MLSFMNFKGTVVNQMITPHNETRFLSDQLKKKQSQQKKCDFSANDSTTISVRSAFAGVKTIFLNGIILRKSNSRL